MKRETEFQSSKEQIDRSEQGSTNTLDDLSLFARFYIEQAAERAHATKSEFNKKSELRIIEKFAGIQDVLTTIKNKDINTIDDAIVVLDKRIDRLDDIMSRVEKNDSDLLLQFERYQRYQTAAEFLRNNKDRNLKGLPAFTDWREQQSAQRMQQNKKEREEVVAAADQIEIMAARKQIGLETPQEVERRREEVINTALREGGFRAHTSVPAEQSQEGRSGFQGLINSRFLRERGSYFDTPASNILTPREISRGDRVQNKLLENGVHEIVTISHEVQQVFETVVIPEKRNWLGRVTQSERQEKKPTGQTKRMLHNELVSNGKNEPAVRITYEALDTSRRGGWRDYSGRTGQMLLTELVLPESQASMLAQAMEQDPSLIRDLVKRFMKEKILKDSNTWDVPVEQGDSFSPPYKKWDAEPNGGKIYIQPENAIPGWHEEFVKKLTT